MLRRGTTGTDAGGDKWHVPAHFTRVGTTAGGGDETTDSERSQQQQSTIDALRTLNLIMCVFHMCFFLVPFVAWISGAIQSSYQFELFGPVSRLESIPSHLADQPFACPAADDSVTTCAVCRQSTICASPGLSAPKNYSRAPLDGATTSRDYWAHMLKSPPVCAAKEDAEQDERTCDYLDYQNWLSERREEEQQQNDDGLERFRDTVPMRERVLSLDLFLLILTFPLLTSVCHFVCWLGCQQPESGDGGDKKDGWYVRALRRHMQPLRWLEYSITSSIMMIGIANLCSVQSLGSIVLHFAASVSTNMFGLSIDSTRTSLGKHVFFVAGHIPFIASWFDLLNEFSVRFAPLLSNEQIAEVLGFVEWLVYGLGCAYMLFPINTAVVLWRMQQTLDKDASARNWIDAVVLAVAVCVASLCSYIFVAIVEVRVASWFVTLSSIVVCVCLGLSFRGMARSNSTTTTTKTDTNHASVLVYMQGEVVYVCLSFFAKAYLVTVVLVSAIGRGN